VTGVAWQITGTVSGTGDVRGIAGRYKLDRDGGDSGGDDKDVGIGGEFQVTTV
jgi:hypothetical protein